MQRQKKRPDTVRLNLVQSIPGRRGKRLRIKSAEYPLHVAPFLSVSEAQNPNESDCCSFSVEINPLPHSVDE